MSTFNRITTGTIRRRDGWHIVLTYSHTEHNEKRQEVSRRAFASEGNAREVATALAIQIGEEMNR